MAAFAAALEAEQSGQSGTATPSATSTQASSNSILALLAKLGAKPGAATTQDADTNATKSDSSTTDTNAAAATATGVVPIALQPQLAALGFASDTGVASSAAQKAIDVATSGTPGAGLVFNAIANALGGTTSGTTSATTPVIAPVTAPAATSGATQAVVDGATQAAAQAANDGLAPAATATAAVAQTSDDVAKVATSAELAAQGIVSIVGKVAVATDVQHTVASQTLPHADDTAATTAHVALTALQQTSNAVTTPLSRMADIRAKLQAAQLGAGKTPVAGTSTPATTSASSSATTGDLLSSATGAAAPTQSATAAFDPTAKQAFAQLFGKTPANNPGDQAAVTDRSSDKSQSGGTGATLSDRIDAQFSASLANLTQGQTTQSTAQIANLANQAVPYAAVASTIAAHAKAGSSEFNIRLDPGGLGQIDVKMKVSSDGEVRAHLIVDQPATLDLMMRDRQHLQQQLDQAGFKTDSSSLQFSLRDQGQGSSQQQAWQQQSSASRQQPQAGLSDSTAQIQPVAYTRQSYVRTDAIDISI